jgi:hypothetical protein
MASVTSTQGISHAGVSKVSKTCIAPDYNSGNTEIYFPEYSIKRCHCIKAIITSVLTWVCYFTCLA